MSEHRNYITWVDRETNEQSTLIGELVAYDQHETGGTNKSQIENLQPFEQYAIYMSIMKEKNLDLTSINELFSDFVEFAHLSGVVPVTREAFIADVQAQTNVTLVKIGDKDYFLGIALKNG